LKIQKPPFYAIPVSPGITYTMGGIKIDSYSRVLDEHDKVISGVYAVGSTTGGLEGGEMSGYIGGLCKAAVTGLRAGEHIINKLQVEN
jgi:fumarate reductase flavoprotein subunit